MCYKITDLANLIEGNSLAPKTVIFGDYIVPQLPKTYFIGDALLTVDKIARSTRVLALNFKVL